MRKGSLPAGKRTVLKEKRTQTPKDEIMQIRHHSTRRIFVLTAIISMFLSLFWQSGYKKGESPVGPSSGVPPDLEGTPISDAVRQVSIDEVQKKFAGLKWKNYDADKAALVQYLCSRPEFEEADIGDGASVWARYTDGRLIIIAHNRLVDDIITPTTQLFSPRVLQKTGDDIPKSKEA